jgi:hypothetical protein
MIIDFITANIQYIVDKKVFLYLLKKIITCVLRTLIIYMAIVFYIYNEKI